MNKQSEKPVDEQTLDGLLSELEHDVPPGFSRQVMLSIDASANRNVLTQCEQMAPQIAAPPLGGLQWCALVVGGVLGVGQIARIVFGLWFSAAAW